MLGTQTQANPIGCLCRDTAVQIKDNAYCHAVQCGLLLYGDSACQAGAPLMCSTALSHGVRMFHTLGFRLCPFSAVQDALSHVVHTAMISCMPTFRMR